MTLAEFEKYAKEHNIFYCTKELGEQIKVETPPILKQIRAEIQKVLDTERDFTSENAKAQAIALFWVLELFDKYEKQAKGGE